MNPMPACAGEPGQQPWPPRLDVLQGQEPLGLRGVHQPEVARPQDDQLLLRALGPVPRWSVRAVGPRRAARGLLAHPVVPGEVVEKRLDASPALDVLLEGQHVLAGQGAAQVAEGGAVAVGERRALRLAVVGEHHEVVATGGGLVDRLEHSEGLVEPAEHLERLEPVAAGVVGHLVEVHEVDVHAPAPPASSAAPRWPGSGRAACRCSPPAGRRRSTIDAPGVRRHAGADGRPGSARAPPRQSCARCCA